MIKLVAVDMDGTFLDDQMHYNRTIFRKIYNYLQVNYICLFDYLFISSQMSAKPYFIGSTGILL
ncbi:MAG: hypothetical protein E6761_16180, partial [Coprobacillus sp.]|nr:hypothetical protein [Coprobacillus sp.]